MPEPKLLPHHMPGWPRLLSIELAAAYVSLSPTTFQREVEEGTFPKPQNIGRRVLWDRQLIDIVQNRRSGIEVPLAGNENAPEASTTTTHDPLMEKLNAKVQHPRRMGKRRP